MKKWYDEEYEFTVEVTGFLRGDHTERYCRNGEHLFQDDDDALSADGGGPQRRRPGEPGRRQQIHQDDCLPGRVRDVPADCKAAGK